MELKRLSPHFSICKVADLSQTGLSQEFCFIGKTDEEISVVCPTYSMPSNCLETDNGWKAFRIQGVLDFSLIGILAKISAILAEHEIGIFVVSTYNTDYVLVKEQNFDQALEVLSQAGYTVV